jgi:hypothetical protein
LRQCALILVIVACACAGPRPVTLDRYRGVLTTHFDGVPDRSAICAVVTNRGEEPVDWVTLRLRSYPTYWETEAGRSPRWTSTWTHQGRMKPGETRAFRLVQPPVADQIELELRRAGSGELPRAGRPLVPSEACSEAWLQRQLTEEKGDRTAPGIALYPIVRRNQPPDVVLAREP